MKALKEKRISLRSLWRRGLVILSLFALLFAACSDSTTDDTTTDGGSGSGSGANKGKIVNRIDITALPARQYLGQPVDLTGIEATITFSDGTSKTESDVSKFAASPRIVYGTYNPGTGAFKGMDTVLITYHDEGGMSGANIKTLTDVIGIARDDTKNVTPDWVTQPNFGSGYEGLYDQGLQLTGVPKMTKKKYFVDDGRDDINWGNLTLEAYYEDGAWKSLNFDDVQWMILPDYNRPIADGSYEGWIYITVGALDLGNLNYDVDGTGFVGAPAGYKPITGSGNPATVYDGGITIRVPLDVVYPVNEIKVVPKGTVPDFFFWDSNSPTAWETRLITGECDLEITYYGTEVTHTYSIKKLSDQKKIWLNPNPDQPSLIQYDFAVLPVEYPFTAKGNADPHILVYYRGGLVKFPVDVYTNLQDIKADNKKSPGQPVNWSGDPPVGGQDNDKPYKYGGTEQGFADELDVSATYAAYNANATKQSTTLPLKWKASPVASGENYGAWYTTNYATIVGVGSGYNGVKDGQTKAITITHTVNGVEVDALGPFTAYNHNKDLHGTALGAQTSVTSTGNTKTQSKKTSVQVTWQKN